MSNDYSNEGDFNFNETYVPEELYKLEGGKKNDDDDDNEKKSELLESSMIQMETLSPKYRRPMCSVFEYSRVLTLLSYAIFHAPSLKEYIDNGENISSMTNYCEIAYQLIKNKKWDARLDNGYDPVSLSQLKINPRWEQMIEIYLKELNESRNRELFADLE